MHSQASIGPSDHLPVCTKIQENAILLGWKAPVSELEEILDEPKSIGGTFAFSEDLKTIAER